MFKSTFIIWASRQLNFIRGLVWFIAGFALAVNSLTLGVVLMVVAFLLNFLACRLEVKAVACKTAPTQKPRTAQNSSPQLDIAALYKSLLDATNPPD